MLTNHKKLVDLKSIGFPNKDINFKRNKPWCDRVNPVDNLKWSGDYKIINCAFGCFNP